MKLRLVVAIASFLLASASVAQTMQAIKQPLQIQPLQATTLQPPNPQLESNDPQHKIAALEAENARLKREIAQLRADRDAMTQLGGAQVHAYCPSITVSKNTSGAERDCASGGYNCDQVSGQCFTSCTNGDACSPGFNCDAERQLCVSGVPQSD